MLVNRSTERPRSLPLEDLELRTSQQLVGIIDILLGLTLVEGAVSFRSMFAEGSNANLPAMVAMVLIYYTAVRSFIDWHIAMEVRPYRILTEGSRLSELGRVLLDFVIMASYSFLILRAHILIEKPGSDILAIAITYPAIYCAYIVWGILRENTTPGPPLQRETPKPFRPTLLLVTLLIACGLLAGYVVGRAHGWLGSNKADLNTALLCAELLLIGWYRHKNWSQQLKLRKDFKAHHRSRKRQVMAALDPEIVSPALSDEDRQQLNTMRDAAAKLNNDILSGVIARLVEN